nr:leucine--tRNA ligase, cytoplasmic [Tanacetum cinerariifolium]
MNKLKESGKIVKDRGYIIYSPLDGQPCADHDRASGEGVTKDEYIIIKMEVVPPFPAKFESLSGKKVYLGAAIRPETMHCQTNVLVLPDGRYGAFEINESEVFVLTERAARNLAYQGLSRVPETHTCLMELTGHDLIGLPLRSPLTSNEIICGSMDSVLSSKGTGIELACDSPDETKILSRRSEMLERGQAVVYFEPEKKVISRSGDECVVALTDQWCITYGEPSWKKKAKDCLKKMKIYSEKTTYGESSGRKDAEANTKSSSDFEKALDRIEKWACSRSFGLGTRIPWDEEFLVESLSDSTIYMAYYTVSHLLQNGEIFGVDARSVKPEQLTDDVWDYIFLEGPEPKSSNIPSSLLKKMRKEFEYWYPFDLRVSGKDLIENHLTFCIYNHTAIFPERHWPRGFRCNGHIMLNNKKMSKSTGDFKTLKEAIEEFSADATRFSLADAGDGMDDANFVSKTANEAILWLTKEKEWMEEILADNSSKYRVGPPVTFADRVFANKINYAIKTTEKNYNEYKFREALKTGFHELQTARNDYILLCGMGGMNRELLWRFMDIQTRLIVPICPHYAEYVWRKLLKKEGFVIKAGWPEAENHDLILEEAYEYLKSSISNFSEKRTSAPDEEILKALEQIRAISQEGNLNETKKQCMPFIKFKKDQASKLGAAALDKKLQFGEIDVLQENLEFIKRQLGLEHVEILSVTDPNAAIKAGSHASILQQTAPSPGSPTSIFFS